MLILFSKKPRGSQPGDPACFCCKRALMCVAEASTARLSFTAWAGFASLVAEASICLTSEKAASLSPFHSTAVRPFGPPLRQSVSSFSALVAPAENGDRINHAEEHLQLLHCGRPGEVCHRRHVLCEQLHPFSREVVSQELDAGCPEDALLHIDDQPVLSEAGEELATSMSST